MMTMDALDILGGRIREVAETMLADAEDSDEIRKLTAIRDTFTVAPQKPCHDFVQASIVFVWIFSFDGIDSPGYFDQYMYDFWKVTEPAIRREYLEAVWQFFHNTRSWNLCIGGSDENWNDLSNDLTYEILDVTAKYKYQTPNLTMRCHREHPRKAPARRLQGNCDRLRYAHALQRRGGLPRSGESWHSSLRFAPLRNERL